MNPTYLTSGQFFFGCTMMTLIIPILVCAINYAVEEYQKQEEQKKQEAIETARKQEEAELGLQIELIKSNPKMTDEMKQWQIDWLLSNRKKTNE